MNRYCVSLFLIFCMLTASVGSVFVPEYAAAVGLDDGKKHKDARKKKARRKIPAAGSAVRGSLDKSPWNFGLNVAYRPDTSVKNFACDDYMQTITSIDRPWEENLNVKASLTFSF